MAILTFFAVLLIAGGQDVVAQQLGVSVVDVANPYRMAAMQGRVVEIRPDEGCRYMDPISYKYTNAPFPSRGADRVCFVIAVDKARATTLWFRHTPGL